MPTYIGAHVSAAGGVQYSIDNAKSIGADAIQMFGSSPRQWFVRSLSESDKNQFQLKYLEGNFGPTFFHAPYLINLGSPDEDLRTKSEKLLTDSLKNAEFLGVKGVIFHIGSRRDMSWNSARIYVISSLKRILKHIPGTACLVIENSAGGGNTIGSSFEEIAEIVTGVCSPRLCVCYDTAHGFESGIIEEYTDTSVSQLYETIDKVIGNGKLIAVHLNDSKTPFRSNADRHENIGEGYIGLSGIRAFVKNEYFRTIPWYLEVPGFDGNGPDKKNIDIVRSMLL